MKILVYPYDKNPYQKLLYGSMRDEFKSRVKIRYMFFLPIFGALHIPLELAIRRLMGYRIIHIHWIAFYIKKQLPHNLAVSWYVTRFNFWWMKQLGYKVIWTVHDIVPHQAETNNDIDISKKLSQMAAYKIVHSTFAISQMTEAGLDTSNIIVIPHGNYDGRYKSIITKKEARSQLRIKDSKIVFLFFGIIKDYKGVDDLLDAYAVVKTANTMLVIAGKCKDQRLETVLKEASKASDILLVNEYIADDDVAIYFEAADMVCLPFKSIVSSGSILLALTFGKPIIAPLEGSLKDLPNHVGILYKSNDINGLVKSLKQSLDPKVDLRLMALASRKYADTLDWTIIAKKTYELYRIINDGK